MILPDVDVLVYAFRREAPDHGRYAGWLSQVVSGAEELALHDVPLAGFLRIVTNPRILEQPTPTGIALGFVRRLIAARRARWLPSAAATWNHLAGLVDEDPALLGNLVPDTHLAALSLAHGCRLATADRGFARFPGLDWFDPIR